MARIPGVPFIQGRNAYADRDGKKFGIAIHCTANTASARDEASYATRRTDGVSGHLYADGTEVIQSLLTRARAGHAGSTAGNDNAYAVEITGHVTWSRAKWLSSVAWEKLGAALAWLIRNDPNLKGFQVRRASVDEMKKNPKVKALYGHDDMRQAWGGTTHTDPGPNFPWDRLIQAVNAALTGKGTDMQLDSKLTYAQVPDVDYSQPTTTVGGILVSGYAYLLQHRTRTARELAAQRQMLEALLAAQQGLDTAAVLARIDEHAAAEAERDAQAAQERAAMRELVEQARSGERDAGETIRRIGEILAATGN
ncbi:MAG TPA: N-acetylmuramoyl-L-alanine amidase [Micromonospora sp.]|nr:N-acetylmuramoyl-L-alanine amidase [Micromonospora sp.]